MPYFTDTIEEALDTTPRRLQREPKSRRWRVAVQPSQFERTIRTGRSLAEVKIGLERWPRKFQTDDGLGLDPLDLQIGPFWRAGSSQCHHWVNLDFDAPCRSCLRDGNAEKCKHKDPAVAAVEVAYRDAMRFCRFLSRFGLEPSRWNRERLQVADYTFVLSGRRGLGVLFSRLLPEREFRGLRRVVHQMAENFSTLDVGALREGTIRIPLSQHPGHDGERAGLRLPLCPDIVGDEELESEFIQIQEYSQDVPGRLRCDREAAEAGLGAIFKDVLLPRLDSSEPWEEFRGFLEDQVSAYRNRTNKSAASVPTEIRRAASELGILRNAGGGYVGVCCPVCGEDSGWFTPGRRLKCFRPSCLAHDEDGGLSYREWVTETQAVGANDVRAAFARHTGSQSSVKAVESVRTLVAEGLPVSMADITPVNGEQQFFDPWLPARVQFRTDNDAQADAFAAMSWGGTGSHEVTDWPGPDRVADITRFRSLPYDQWREFVGLLVGSERLLCDLIPGSDLVWLSVKGHGRYVVPVKVFGLKTFQRALAGLSVFYVSTQAGLRQLVTRGKVPVGALRDVPLKVIEVSVSLLNNTNGTSPTFSRRRLMQKLSGEPVELLALAEELDDVVESRGLGDVAELEHQVALESIALEHAAPEVRVAQARERRDALASQVDSLEGRLQAFIGPLGNLNSDDDVKDRFREEGFVFENLQNNYLRTLSPADPTADLLDAYVEWDEKSRRLDELRGLLSNKTPTIASLGACTGRFSYSDWNPTGISRALRKFLRPVGDQVFVSLDISQAQVRILADLCGDEHLLEVFRTDGDVHSLMAGKILKKSVEEVEPQERTCAKAVTFGVSLGMGAETLVGKAKDFGVELTEDEAGRLIHRFFSEFPRVQAYRDALYRRALEVGFVRNRFGRKVALDPTEDFHHGTSLAYMLQMTEADIIKTALCRLANSLDLDRARPTLVVHDELVLCSEFEYAEEAGRILQESTRSAMAQHFERCPLGVGAPEITEKW